MTMKANINTTVTLVMDGFQAKWLKAVMQNPLSNDPDPANEDPQNRKMRLEFWDALDDFV